MYSDLEIDKKYQIQNPRNQSYRVTLPTKFFDKYNIKNNLNLDIKLSENDNFGVIKYITENTQGNISRKMTKSNHTIRIPSSIGDCLLASQHTTIQWSSIIEDDVVTFNAQTSYELPKINIDDWNYLKSTNITPIKQSIKNKDGNIKEQEHFDIYFTESETDTLNWSDETHVEMSFVLVNNQPSLKIQPVSENTSRLGKKVSSSGFKQNDSRIYIPRALIRSLCMVGYEFNIYQSNQSIVLQKSV